MVVGSAGGGDPAEVRVVPAADGRAVDLATEPSALQTGRLACRPEEAATINGVGAVRAITLPSIVMVDPNVAMPRATFPSTTDRETRPSAADPTGFGLLC